MIQAVDNVIEHEPDIGALDDELYTGSQINTGISRSVRAWYASYGGYASMIVGQSSAFFSGNT